MEWDRAKCLQLLEEYEKHPVLWNPRHGFYYNKGKKAESWAQMAKVLDCYVEEARKKMESLLASFRREKTKERKTIALGEQRGTHEVYVSRWFAFNKMASFLLDREEPTTLTASTTSVMPEPEYEYVKQEMELDDATTELGADPTSSDDNDDTQEMTQQQQQQQQQQLFSDVRSTTEATPTPPPPPHIPTAPPPAAVHSPSLSPAPPTPQNVVHKRKRDDDVTMLAPFVNPSQPELRRAKIAKRDDSFDIFGKNVANKLRGMVNEQRIFTEKLINDAMFYGELGALSLRSRVEPAGHDVPVVSVPVSLTTALGATLAVPHAR